VRERRDRITFGIMPPLDHPPRSKNERQLATSARALGDLAAWTGLDVGIPET
jgi:folate-dependent tRNA-U54 methylase TrmFO/GidA